MTELFHKYIKGTATPEEKEELLKDLNSSTPSGELLHSLKKYWYELENNCRNKEFDADFEAILHRIHHSVNRIEEEERQAHHTFLHRFTSQMRVAAIVIIVLLASAGVWYAGSTGMFQKEQFYTVSSVRGQSSSVSLPDGSKAWLNGKSSIRYSSRYGSGNRKLELEGEGFFQVAEDAENAFVVKIDDVEITALGTAFNVDGYDEDCPIKVTLDEGKVRIRRDEEEMDLGPGMQARIHDDKMECDLVDTELYTSWHKGQIVFKDEKLKTITDQLEKLYDVEFVYRADTLRNFRYRGTIRLDHSILKALDMLQISTGIEYEIKNNRVTLDETSMEL